MSHLPNALVLPPPAAANVLEMTQGQHKTPDIFLYEALRLGVNIMHLMQTTGSEYALAYGQPNGRGLELPFQPSQEAAPRVLVNEWAELEAQLDESGSSMEISLPKLLREQTDAAAQWFNTSPEELALHSLGHRYQWARAQDSGCYINLIERSALPVDGRIVYLAQDRLLRIVQPKQ